MLSAFAKYVDVHITYWWLAEHSYGGFGMTFTGWKACWLAPLGRDTQPWM